MIRPIWFVAWAGVIGVIATSFLFIARDETRPKEVVEVKLPLPEEQKGEFPERETLVESVPQEELMMASYLIPGVPFMVQAPGAKWGDPVFQDACEEASLLMASAWVTGTTLTKEEATQKITELATFQKKKFGHSVDTSIEDTSILLEEYLGIKSGEVQTGITIDDIKDALASKRVVIIPTDGRLLKNPNFTPPGPSRHMLVIVGYDALTKEFIVNDPGTRKGEGYRYDEEVLYDAILDYPTGKHELVVSDDKVMLSVSRSSL